MDRDSWNRVEALFDAAWDLPPDGREAWLAAQDAPPEVLDAVRRLLADAEATEGFLEPAPVQPSAAATPPLSLKPGDRAGPWEIVRPIGAGGMGEVYEARRADGAYDQRAALKIIGRAGAQAWERFQSERRILAGLDHPGIARIIDGGLLADSRPFMVMEFVDGGPIDAWRRSRNLGLHETARLGAALCDALAHAHARLVVHRDLKPSNILVDAEGRPRLIDFGVARLIDDGAGAETAAPMSVDYAAPEQMAGGAISTATDTYGLAAVLYELVAGEPPVRASGQPLAVAVARVMDARPESLAARVRPGPGEAALLGDLDAILAKALRKDPADRYLTAQALKDDLERALAGDPVEARRGERGYRLRRFVRRRRWPIAAAAAIAVSLTTGLGLALWQAGEAARQRDEALREQARLEAVQQSIFLMFRSAGELQGAEATAAQVLDSAARRIDREFQLDPRRGAPVLHALGELYFLLTDYEAAEPLLVRLADADPARVDPSLIALGRYDLAQTLHRKGDNKAAAARLAQAQAFWSADPARWETRLVDSRLLEAQLMREAGDGEGAVRLLQAALPRRIALSGPAHRETGVFHNNLGVALAAVGRYDEAREAFKAANLVWTAAGLEQSPDALNTLNNWGAVEISAGNLKAAEPLLRRAVDLRRRLFGPSGATAALLNNYGKLLLQTGRPAEALPILREAADMGRDYAGGGMHLVAPLAGVAEALLALGRTAEAETTAAQALAEARKGLGPAHPGTAVAAIAMARVRAEQGRKGEAVALLAEVDAIAARAGPAGQRLAAMAGQVRTRYGLASPRRAG